MEHMVNVNYAIYEDGHLIETYTEEDNAQFNFDKLCTMMGNSHSDGLLELVKITDDAQGSETLAFFNCVDGEEVDLFDDAT